MVLRTLGSCSPFIACGLISTFTGWGIGTAVGLALSVVLLVGVLWGAGGIDEAVIEISAVVFCAIALVLAYVTPQAGIREFVGALSNGWLALTAWGSIALRRPFTKSAERRRVDEVVSGHPLFHRTHVVVTAMWAAGFTATTAVLAIVEDVAPHSGFVEILIQIGGNAVPAVFAYRYLNGRRHEAAADGTRPQPGSAAATSMRME